MRRLLCDRRGLVVVAFVVGVLVTNNNLLLFEYSVGELETMLLRSREQKMSNYGNETNTSTLQDDVPVVSRREVIDNNIPWEKGLPNFFLAGVQKGGTSAVIQYLMERHNVCGPLGDPNITNYNSRKETHFFDLFYRHSDVDKAIMQYRNVYRRCTNASAIWVDGTPENQLYPEKIHDFYEKAGMVENVKILFIFREPISREVSWYRHKFRLAAGKCEKRESIPHYARSLCNADGPLAHLNYTLQAAILQTHLDSQKRYCTYNLYEQWLRKWSSFFPRRQIMIANYHEEIRQANQTDFVKRLLGFLGLPPLEDGEDAIFPRENSEKSANETLPSCELQMEWYQRFEPHNAALYKLLNEEETGHGVDRIREAADKDSKAPPIQERKPFTPFQFECTRR